MWIYLKDGFFSIVEDTKHKNTFLVRARVKGDIEKVFVVPPNNVACTPDDDYRFRTILPKNYVLEMLSSQIDSIKYDNYKANISDKERREYWYNRVWETMALMQDHLAVREDYKEKV